MYTTVKDHFESDNPPPLRMIVTGTAGTGKSYLIQCIRLLLGDKLTVAAPTGVASFIIEGSLVPRLSVGGERESLVHTVCACV